MRDVTHSNGLTLKIPATYAVRETPDGFVVEPADNANAQTRYPTEVEVARRQASDFTVPADAKEKSVADRTINYIVEEGEGGSGGSEHELTAWENVPDGFVVYQQRQQAEHSTPEFEMCWTVIKNSSLK